MKDSPIKWKWEECRNSEDHWVASDTGRIGRFKASRAVEIYPESMTVVYVQASDGHLRRTAPRPIESVEEEKETAVAFLTSFNKKGKK